jgi:predicted NBD/HSP70 family sugar kinase
MSDRTKKQVTSHSRPSAAETEMPTLDVVRRLTDVHVLTQLMTSELLTRSQIAVRTGISKPTISESVKRLTNAGRVVESGRQSDGSRGRTGTYCRLADGIGVAIAMHAGPEGILADVSDLRGTSVYQVQQPVHSPITPRRLTSVIERVARDAKGSVPAPVLAMSMSVADPVDQRSGRITNLPNSPFLIGELRPQSVMARLGFEREWVVVDNDTNFGAMAEHRNGNAQDLDDFGYLWLGAGIGLGLIINGRLHRGWTGLAGEIWQTVTRGPAGQAMGLVDCFTQMGLTTSGSSAIDVDRVIAILASRRVQDAKTKAAIIDSVAVALANATALINPKAVVVAGPWSNEASRGLLAGAMRGVAVPTEIREPLVTGNPFLAGARIDALDRARGRILDAPIS